MRRIPYLLIFLVIISSVYAGPIYKWTDEKGVVNYSDDYNKIPPAYRNRSEVEKWEDVQKPEAPSPAPLQKNEEAKTDTYSREESYWRGRMRPWKEQLKQATANYETASKKYTERLSELSGKEQLSRTQHQMGITELHSLNEEKMTYKAQIEEANKMLEKIAKEANEEKVNPDWLK